MPLLNQSQDVQMDNNTLNDIQGSQYNIVNNFSARQAGDSSRRYDQESNLSRCGDAELYTQLLLLCGHGYPQWIPEPNVLQSGHEEHGACIGDVGIVDPRRSFDFLFNICNSSESRINSPHGLPVGTPPITAQLEISSQPKMWKRDHVIWSLTMERNDLNSKNLSARVAATFRVKSSFNHGALLVLPEGASREDLMTERDFQGHALRYGLAWYRHAREVRRRICPNGSLYLVTGVDKTRSWGLTSFSTTSDMRMVSVKLGIANTSSWEYAGCAMFRQSDDNCPPAHENQCVFLRGFTISERGLFSATLTGQEVRVEDGKGLSPGILSLATSNRNTAWTLVGSTLSKLGNRLSGSEQTEDETGENDSEYTVGLQPVPGRPQSRYPSDIINEWMLREVPDAQVAITHDHVWCALIDEEDVLPLQEDELISRVCAYYVPVARSGGVLLVPRVITNDTSSDLDAASEHIVENINSSQQTARDTHSVYLSLSKTPELYHNSETDGTENINPNPGIVAQHDDAENLLNLDISSERPQTPPVHNVQLSLNNPGPSSSPALPNFSSGGCRPSYETQTKNLSLHPSAGVSSTGGDGVMLVHASPTPTYSPTYSVTSLPSTGGPITPPNLYRSPLPLLSDVPVHIHPTLRCNPQVVPILFDVSILPATAKTNTSPPLHLSNHILLEPATYPPINSLALISQLPWELTIIPSSQPYVAVIDVLEQLYRSLRLNVGQREFDMESRASRDAITAAFYQRLNRDRQTAAVEKKKGLKRVDFLKGHNQFAGLSSTKEGPTVWTLNVR